MRARWNQPYIFSHAFSPWWPCMTNHARRRVDAGKAFVSARSHSVPTAPLELLQFRCQLSCSCGHLASQASAVVLRSPPIDVHYCAWRCSEASSLQGRQIHRTSNTLRTSVKHQHLFASHRARLMNTSVPSSCRFPVDTVSSLTASPFPAVSACS